MATKYVAVTGLNLPPDDTRYEAGDTVPASRVEPWMLEDGVVSDGKTKPATSTGGE